MSTRWLSDHSSCFIAQSPSPNAIPSYTSPNKVRSKTKNMNNVINYKTASNYERFKTSTVYIHTDIYIYIYIYNNWLNIQMSFYISN